MKRVSRVIGIKPERIAEYERTHAGVGPQVLAKISDCNIRNAAIFLREPENFLFGGRHPRRKKTLQVRRWNP
jgi:L-rhamnose mutarotase